MSKASTSHDLLARRIAELSAVSSSGAMPNDAEEVVDALLRALEAGDVRAAERSDQGAWHAVSWVKQGILLGFRIGQVIDMTSYDDRGAPARFFFFDKHTYPPHGFDLTDGVRIVPGGSSIRRGAYLAPGVVCMPPMYVNVGAYVGKNTMVDSHALVGSCAQIGERVHLSAAAQIGGVLEPVSATPVVIEDDVLVGGNCGVYEGTIVRERAVLAAGVILTRGTPVFDLVRETVYRGDAHQALEIPAGAVVVPGARQIRGEWAAREGLSLQTPVIVKYRDEQTDLATTLEEWLR
ncbi:MAG TPA: 2,3,4,5-tetrahydropyridine-2,6-dicarboxylate N-succinyltransferase [Gemmatimonadaceae bacterium]